MYIHVYQIIKNRGPGPYNSLHHADNKKYFSGLSLSTKSTGSARVSLGKGSEKNLEMSLLRKRQLYHDFVSVFCKFLLQVHLFNTFPYPNVFFETIYSYFIWFLGFI